MVPLINHVENMFYTQRFDTAVGSVPYHIQLVRKECDGIPLTVEATINTKTYETTFQCARKSCILLLARDSLVSSSVFKMKHASISIVS